ncbi:MAG: glycosyltransferase [Flavobacteriaceae bacterium]
MKILIVNNSVIPVTFYGGTQRVVWGLGKELHLLGHEVYFLVAKGSHSDFAKVLFIDDTKDLVSQIPDFIDVVHFNLEPENLDKLKTPYVITKHGNRNEANGFDKNTIFVSKNHAERFGSNSYVHNGLYWDDYSTPTFTDPQDYFHFLGKAAWRLKNVKGAIKTITNTKSEKIKVLGGKRFNVSMGLRFTLTPRATFYDKVGGTKKDQLLNNSKGLVFPVKWHEPFGLAIIESLYFGCPVFATPYGAIPEIVTEDVGFLSNKSNELTSQIENYQQFSRKKCHEYVNDVFSSKAMTQNYLKKYEIVLNGGKLNTERPKLLEENPPKFLDWSS